MISCFLLIVQSIGCASSPKAKKYAETSLADRSATLPGDTAAWKPVFGFAVAKESSSLIVPLQWETGYTESLTLIWMPLPLQLRYLLFSDSEQWITTEVALFGSNYSRSRDYNWRPSVSIGWKKNLGGGFGYEAKFLFQGEMKRSQDEPFSRTLSLQTGGFLQVTPWLGLNPSVFIWNEYGEVRTQYLGEVPTTLSGPEALKTHWRFPLNLGIVARLASNFELQAEVRYYRLGYEADYTEVPIFLTLIHYW
jgi:hypothetical protein